MSFKISFSRLVIKAVPWPNVAGKYFVFTVDAQGGPRGFSYSIVNMNLAGGFGDVETKNVPLQSQVTEKVTAVKHCNNRDVWVITHGTESNTYYSFLVTQSGVQTTAVISNTGTVLPGIVPPASLDSSTLGYLKASPDGSRLAAAHFVNGIEVSDFNNATGVVSNTLQLFTPAENYYLQYGVEFSPNGNLLYTTAFFRDPVSTSKHNALYPFDVSLPTEAAIQASRQLISLNSDPIQSYGALQIAPDGIMYMSKPTYKHISAIQNPNVYGAGCGFVNNSIQYSGFMQEATFGFPSFVQSYFYPEDSFDFSVQCPGLDVEFYYAKPSKVNSLLWDFGDPASGTENTSVADSPTHRFSASGNYTVRLITFGVCGSDTLEKTVQVAAVDIDLGADTTLCGSDNLHLNASAIGSTDSFLWQDGSTNPDLVVHQSGLYWVESQNSLGCIFRDSIIVNFVPSPVFSLGADTSICSGTGLNLQAYPDPQAQYIWSTGQTNASIVVQNAGIYWAEVDLAGCIHRDSIEVLEIIPMPTVNLGADLELCEAETHILQAGHSGVWQDGSSASEYRVEQPGVYFVQVNDRGCKASDTVNVSYEYLPRFTLGPDQPICIGGSPIVLQPDTNPIWQLEWQDGTTTTSYTATTAGMYTLTATNNCGSFRDDVLIFEGVCQIYIPTAFTPNQDGLNDVFRVLGVETVTEFSLHIYNRYGQPVFTTQNKHAGWDGKLAGKAAPIGGYVYVLRFKMLNDATSYVRKGQLLLLQ